MACSSWRNSFLSEEEIEILWHWVSCLNPRISEYSSSDLSVNKYKHKIQKNLWRRAVLQGRWSKRYCLKKYLLQVLSIWNGILNVAICTVKKALLMLASSSSNAFPGKCFVQYKLMLNFTCRSLSGIRSALVAAAASEPEANERGSAEDFSY